MNDKLIDKFLHDMAEIDRDRQEACIHCGKVWYVIHHKDGVCHECQKKGLPGRTVLARRKAIKTKVLCALPIVATTLILIISYKIFY